jgi:hypothetical protein
MTRMDFWFFTLLLPVTVLFTWAVTRTAFELQASDKEKQHWRSLSLREKWRVITDHTRP